MLPRVESKGKIIQETLTKWWSQLLKIFDYGIRSKITSKLRRLTKVLYSKIEGWSGNNTKYIKKLNPDILCLHLKK